MSKKKRYSIIFYLSENTWSMSGIPCPDCVNESNYQAWSQYLSKQIDKLLCAETMQTVEFQEELEEVRRDKDERIVLKTEDIHPPKTGISVHFSGSLV